MSFNYKLINKCNNKIDILKYQPRPIYLSKENQIVCRICPEGLQSKHIFTNTISDYNIACRHIQDVILAIEYKNQQNPLRPWPDEWPFPCTSESVCKCNSIIDSKLDKKLNKFLNKKKIVHIENIETLSYFDKLIDNYSIIKENGKYTCTCKGYFYKKNCKHINFLYTQEQKYIKMISLSIFLAFKYFNYL